MSSFEMPLSIKPVLGTWKIVAKSEVEQIDFAFILDILIKEEGDGQSNFQLVSTNRHSEIFQDSLAVFVL